MEQAGAYPGLGDARASRSPIAIEITAHRDRQRTRLAACGIDDLPSEARREVEDPSCIFADVEAPIERITHILDEQFVMVQRQQGEKPQAAALVPATLISGGIDEPRVAHAVRPRQ